MLQKTVAQQRAEEEKWRDVPEWKKGLIISKEKKRKEENVSATSNVSDTMVTNTSLKHPYKPKIQVHV